MNRDTRTFIYGFVLLAIGTIGIIGQLAYIKQDGVQLHNTILFIGSAYTAIIGYFKIEKTVD